MRTARGLIRLAVVGHVEWQDIDTCSLALWVSYSLQDAGIFSAHSFHPPRRRHLSFIRRVCTEGTSPRCVTNMGALEALLLADPMAGLQHANGALEWPQSARAVYSVFPTNVSFMDQLRIFSHSCLIVGTHGAGLTKGEELFADNQKMFQ